MSEKKYDIIIAGSGLGGLLSAAILAKEGYSVIVLEKNRQFGGALQIFSRDKIIYDTGVHYLGGLAPGQNLHRIFNYVGIYDSLELERLDEKAFDIVSFEGDPQTYNFAQGFDSFREQMTEYFPDSADDLKNYVDTIIKITKEYPVYDILPNAEALYNTKYMDITMDEFLKSTIKNPTLRQVLCGNAMVYAPIREYTSAYIHAAILHSYINSSWKCIGGGGQIATQLVKQIKSHGGEVMNYAEVSKILTQSDLVSGVELTDGRTIYGKNLIANIHPLQIIKLLDSPLFTKAYRNRLQTIPNSIASFTINAKLKSDTVPTNKSNYYHSRISDVFEQINYTEKQWPPSFGLFYGKDKKDSGFMNQVNILAYMRGDEMKHWEDTFRTIPKQDVSRGEEYNQFKEEKAELLLNTVYGRFPELKGAIDRYSIATPLTYRDYLYYPEGSMYGMIKNAQNPFSTYLSPRTKIENLYMTGQNINVHGSVGTALSALRTCSHFIDQKELFNRM